MADTLTFIDPAGTETVFLVDHAGVTGRFAPPVEWVEDEVAGAAGSRLRALRHTAREVAFPVWLFADTETDLRLQIRALVGRLNPMRGDGILRAATADGVGERDLVCRYAGGFESAVEGGDEGTALEQRVVLVFRAADEPYWLDADDSVLTYQLGAEPVAFFPFFPLAISPSEVFAVTAVDNDGDVEAWPVWVITGPFSSLTLTNTTTAEQLALSTTLGVGEELTIDTRPGAKTVTRGGDTNAFGDLTSPSLWPLAPGGNDIEVEMPGATAESSVQLRWRRRFLAP